MDVAELTVKLLAGTPPKETPVAPVKLVPVMLTLVPPSVVPVVVPRLVTVGTDAALTVKVEAAEVPLGVVTVTPTLPTGKGGDVAVICVLESTVKLAAGKLPKVTAVAPVKSVPVRVTLVPPAVVPLLGFSVVMAGAGVLR